MWARGHFGVGVLPMRVKLTGYAVAAVSLLAAQSALAADLPVKATRLAPAAAYNWTGCHIGGSVGYGWGRNTGYDAPLGEPGFGVPPATPVAPAFDVSGAVGGAYGGCDYQMASWVFGIEGDWSASAIKGQTFEFAGAPVGGGNFIQSVKEQWFSTVRGRVGYAAQNWLLYATGGVAFASLKSAEYNITNPGPTLNEQTDTEVGWTVGAGLEYALGSGWSVRGEYLYIKFPTYTTFTPGSNGAEFTNLSTGLSNNILRGGVTYKFGGM
jgi:outer membrane immunogenic protein